ncbi:DNA helicase-2/ATP-dependent DNA helicase PcrA [Microbacteriaceae bacterium SG_E_30_P1]|uniref:DNA 3'-5' helicase n=1 Tax=Antiquaquibacter oligotrophicus TaxID=2880260 RepID=A0ABT6KMY6_9MICO|nr:UvrD-helicase domain-containing protein [Antiquaquibacter oligotrophicus]MDH6181364.1 DNA helicase-2/ATP-dependent DNA helicase PcrA [Antiquaquibacter oligotrophicus]UDF12943.1 UvrD-helicase domain-containing protein [Antiquaquibacter oligotrophicus]
MIALTSEQLAVVSSRTPLFVKAFPGSGKTTVAAARFTQSRFEPSGDRRAVVGASFTRSATRELAARVRRNAGSLALRYPNRIETLDTLMRDILTSLLRSGELVWPGGMRELDVVDSWAHIRKLAWTPQEPRMTLEGQVLGSRLYRQARPGSYPAIDDFRAAVSSGICSHAEVRQALNLAIASEHIQERIRERFARTVKELIVDEIFDGNELDIAVLRLAIEGGTRLVTIGDPWQALYAFRGARPADISDFLSSFTTTPLTESFRFESEPQRELADALRSGRSVSVLVDDAFEADVVLAPEWKQLWKVPLALPLALGSFKGSVGEAMATVLLNSIVNVSVGSEATFIGEALRTLRSDRERITSAEGEMLRIAAALRTTNRSAMPQIWDLLRSTLQPLVDIELPMRRATSRLEPIRSALEHRGRRVPGMTIHQAKGREWNSVLVVLDEQAVSALEEGLTGQTERERRLYVALTRARRATRAAVI